MSDPQKAFSFRGGGLTYRGCFKITLLYICVEDHIVRKLPLRTHRHTHTADR